MTVITVGKRRPWLLRLVEETVTGNGRLPNLKVSSYRILTDYREKVVTLEKPADTTWIKGSRSASPAVKQTDITCLLVECEEKGTWCLFSSCQKFVTSAWASGNGRQARTEGRLAEVTNPCSSQVSASWKTETDWTTVPESTRATSNVDRGLGHNWENCWNWCKVCRRLHNIVAVFRFLPCLVSPSCVC